MVADSMVLVLSANGLNGSGYAPVRSLTGSAQWGTVTCGASAAKGSGSGTASLPIAFPTAGTLVSTSMASGGYTQNWDAISMWGELNGLTTVKMYVAATFATNGSVGRYVAVGH